MRNFQLPLAGAVLMAMVGAGLALTGQAGTAVSVSSHPQPSEPSLPTAVHLAETALLHQNGTVTVHFTVVCPAGTEVRYPLTMAERVGDAVVHAYTYQGFRCNGERQPFDIDLTPQTSAFTEGTAWLEVFLQCQECPPLEAREITVVR